MNIHPRLTEEVILAAAQEQLFGVGNIGFCVKCGAESDQCEPDADEYLCDDCGSYTVYGACEIAMMSF